MVLDAQDVDELIARGESVAVEFKSDRHQIGDKTIYEEVVALANTEGRAVVLCIFQKHAEKHAGWSHNHAIAINRDSSRFGACVRVP